MKKALIYIGAVTNLGNRAENLRLAAQLLPPAVKILRTSSVYETEPWGFKDQNSFYNLVWEAETTLPPASLLSYLKKIEKRGEAPISDHYPFYNEGVKCFYVYTLGGISEYHNLKDRPETLPYTEYSDLFKLITGFVNELK